MFKNILATYQIEPVAIIKTMAIGAITGLIIISVFIFPVKQPDPAWGKLWTIRPLVMTPLACAFGSLVFFTAKIFRFQSRWKKAVVLVLSCLAFVIVLWMGIVLGLAGTLWD